MNSILKFLKNSGIFFLGNILSKTVVFLLLPLYTRCLPTEAYGYYDLTITYVTVATAILFAEVWSSTLRFVLSDTKKTNTSIIITNSWILFYISAAMFILLGILVSLFLSIAYMPYIILYGIAINQQQMSSHIARGKGQNVIFAISGICNASIMTLLNLVLILCCGMGIEALYIGAIAGNIAQVILIEAKVGAISEFKPRLIDCRWIKRIISFTMPLALNAVAYWLLTSYNRIVISQMLTLEMNGIYAVGAKFGNMIALVTTCFTYAWQDISFRRNSDSLDNAEFYSKAFMLYARFLCAGLVLLIPTSKLLLPLLVDAAYAQVAATIPIFLFMSVISAYATFVGNAFYALNKTKIVFVSTLVACILNIVLVSPLINSMGINGANLSIILSFMVSILIRHIILYKTIKCAVAIGNLAWILGLAICNGLIFIYGGITASAISLLVSTAILCLVFLKDIRRIIKRK